jgi:hypothetical protein
MMGLFAELLSSCEQVIVRLEEIAAGENFAVT